MPAAPGGLAAACLLLAGLAPVGAMLLQVDPVQRGGVRQGQAGAYLIPLQHEKIPIKRAGKVVSHKTTYSGTIHVGSPVPQEFRVVFDTGSAHVVLPTLECESAPCLRRRRYNITASSTGQAVKVDGTPVGPSLTTDSVAIGFGTGKVTGEPVSERVCLGPATEPGPCVAARTIMATQMSGSSFEQLSFDGILGLALSGLALSKAFSLFDGLVGSGVLPHSYFSVYLAQGEARTSEIAIGGHNERRILTPLSWVPIVKPELGYWQVAIDSIRVNGKELDFCQDGTCAGILDSGTSHFGLPSASFATMDNLLSLPARSMQEDCLRVDTPAVELILRGINLTLYARDYMRPLPLSKSIMRTSGGALPDAEQYCRPKLMSMNWPPPMGPKVFILGEVVLQRYYTAYDWSGPRAGFALADHGPSSGGSDVTARMHTGDAIMLVQVTVSVSHRGPVQSLAVTPLQRAPCRK